MLLQDQKLSRKMHYLHTHPAHLPHEVSQAVQPLLKRLFGARVAAAAMPGATIQWPPLEADSCATSLMQHRGDTPNRGIIQTGGNKRPDIIYVIKHYYKTTYIV